MGAISITRLQAPTAIPARRGGGLAVLAQACLHHTEVQTEAEVRHKLGIIQGHKARALIGQEPEGILLPAQVGQAFLDAGRLDPRNLVFRDDWLPESLSVAEGLGP